MQELVRLHGGKVEVRSALNEGTTFTVRLPLGLAHLPAGRVVDDGGDGGEQGASISAPSQSSAYVQEALRWLPEAGVERNMAGPERPSGRSRQLGERYRSTWGARIVIADDNADMRHYLKSLLEPYYDVETASHGEEALQAALRKRPALILSDVMMPKLDGFGLLASVRADKRLRTVPMVLLSARAGEEATVEGLGRRRGRLPRQALHRARAAGPCRRHHRVGPCAARHRRAAARVPGGRQDVHVGPRPGDGRAQPLAKRGRRAGRAASAFSRGAGEHPPG
ncbi:MAG: response regulator [Aquabacterium sp.]